MIKRLFDIFVSGIALTVLSPVILLVAFFVRLSMGAPVLFSQERPGYKGKIFRIRKFRTMTNERDAHGQLLPDSERLHGVGKVIRSLSLDELPQLLNVLVGEMSLVGPRPLLVQYLSLYTAEESRRHDVKPGITGWAQVNGRNALTWKQKFALDVWYVDNRSMLLDLKILAMTVMAVLSKRGVAKEGHVTTVAYDGTN